MSRERRFARLRRVEPVLRRALAGPCALPAGSTLLVAVSGGADSTALLVALASIAGEFSLDLHAAHLDHGLRGRASRADARAVAALCAKLGVPLAAARIDARRAMAARGLAGEDGLRRLRARYLTRVRARVQAAAIATAHTADDQLETLLLRLARGTGLRGLGGMRERSGRRLKPLLDLTRAELEADLVRAGIGWREDATNASRDWARNRIRHDVVPALARATARSRSQLAKRGARAAADARSAEQGLENWVRLRLSRVARIQDGVVRLDSRGLAPYPSAARRIVFRHLWRRLGGSREGLTHRHLDALLALIEPGRPEREVRLPAGGRALRRGHEIRIHAGASRPAARTGTPSMDRMARQAHGEPTDT